MLIIQTDYTGTARAIIANMKDSPVRLLIWFQILKGSHNARTRCP
jgi:hypothetical protein